MVAIPGSNTRETAIVVWTVALLVFGLTNAGVRSSLGSLLKQIFGSLFLIATIVSAVGYAVIAVVVLRQVGYWQHSMLNTTMLWFIGSGIAAVFYTRRSDRRYFRHFVLGNLALAAIVEFVGKLHTFTLPIELLLVLVATVFAMSQVVADSQPEFKTARKPIAVVLTAIGLAVLSLSVAYATAHWDQVATAEKLRDFFLPLVISACFIPYLYVVRMIVVWQTMLHMTRYYLEANEALYKFARRRIISACGLSLPRAQLFDERFRLPLSAASSQNDVCRVVADFQQAYRNHPASDA